jgi:hypothetical protein
MMTMTANPTNREKLLEELSALDSTALYNEMADNNVTRAIDDAMCDDCKAEHGGRCVASGDDEPCPTTLDDWMDAPAREAAILNRA